MPHAATRSDARNRRVCRKRGAIAPHPNKPATSLQAAPGRSSRTALALPRRSWLLLAHGVSRLIGGRRLHVAGLLEAREECQPLAGEAVHGRGGVGEVLRQGLDRLPLLLEGLGAGGVESIVDIARLTRLRDPLGAIGLECAVGLVQLQHRVPCRNSRLADSLLPLGHPLQAIENLEDHVRGFHLPSGRASSVEVLAPLGTFRGLLGLCACGLDLGDGGLDVTQTLGGRVGHLLPPGLPGRPGRLKPGAGEGREEVPYRELIQWLVHGLGSGDFLWLVHGLGGGALLGPCRRQERSRQYDDGPEDRNGSASAAHAVPPWFLVCSLSRVGAILCRSLARGKSPLCRDTFCPDTDKSPSSDGESGSTSLPGGPGRIGPGQDATR